MSTPFRPPISNMKTKRRYKKRKRPVFKDDFFLLKY